MSQFEKKLSSIDYFRLYPRPNYILMFKEPKASYQRMMNLRQKTTTSTSNTLSRNSAMKMKRALSWLVASADRKFVFEKKYGKTVAWRINFITLTIPIQNELDDKKVKRIFNEFCKWAQYNHGLRNYVWRAEVQKRGELHLHIVSDCYIHYSNIRFTWNKLLSNYGLLNGHKNPNSTDVHAVLDCNVNNLTAYTVDYMMKKETDDEGNQRRKISGRLWGCSKALSNAGKNYMLLDQSEAETIHKTFMSAHWKYKEIEGTASSIYFVNGKGIKTYDCIDKNDEIYTIYKKELTVIRSLNTQLALFERNAEMQI